jgi:hypothetical protein
LKTRIDVGCCRNGDEISVSVKKYNSFRVAEQLLAYKNGSGPGVVGL